MRLHRVQYGEADAKDLDPERPLTGKGSVLLRFPDEPAGSSFARESFRGRENCQRHYYPSRNPCVTFNRQPATVMHRVKRGRVDTVTLNVP